VSSVAAHKRDCSPALSKSTATVRSPPRTPQIMLFHLFITMQTNMQRKFTVDKDAFGK
jgi:hypothetical protein